MKSTARLSFYRVTGGFLSYRGFEVISGGTYRRVTHARFEGSPLELSRALPMVRYILRTVPTSRLSVALDGLRTSWWHWLDLRRAS